MNNAQHALRTFTGSPLSTIDINLLSPYCFSNGGSKGAPTPLHVGA